MMRKSGGSTRQRMQQRHQKQASSQRLQNSFADQFMTGVPLRQQNVALNAKVAHTKAAGQQEMQTLFDEVGSHRKRPRLTAAAAESARLCDSDSRDADGWSNPIVETACDATGQPSLQRTSKPSVPSGEKEVGHRATSSTGNGAQGIRAQLQLRIESDANGVCPAPLKSFEAMTSLPQYVLNSLRFQGIQSPLPIQAQALPLILTKSDVIGLAQTGSGKTLAFLIPAAVRLGEQKFPISPKPAVLVLAPTRELAVQISDESDKLFSKSECDAHPAGIRTVCVYGGGDKWQQQKSLKQGAHIVVATPGRLLDFVNAEAVCLAQVYYFVLDEADRMLDMGFHDDAIMIAGRLRQRRQVLFFSATWSDAVQQLALGLCSGGSKPVRISYGQGSSDKSGSEGDAAKCKARAGITQEVIVIDDASGRDRWERQEQQKNEKLHDHLSNVLTASDEHKVLVFVSRKDLADKVSAQLKEKGFKADAMHGGKSQVYRLWVLEQFRQGAVRLLVCTDVLGRGIDIPSVSHVVIHEMGEIEDYIHRIGRTARGRYGKGHALVFFEYWEGAPHVAADLIDVLAASEQHVPKQLQQIADEVAKGERQIRGGRSNPWPGHHGR